MPGIKKGLRINVGCGQAPTYGWRNFDNSPSVLIARVPFFAEILLKARIIQKAQYRYIKFARENKIEFANILKGLPLPDNSVEIFYSSHLLEHIEISEVSTFLNEARRVLASGGVIRLVAPDLMKNALSYIENKDADAFISSLNICGRTPRTVFKRLLFLVVGTRNHQWMYDKCSLCNILLENGFSNPIALTTGETRIDDPGELNLYERESESLYIEAIKL